MIRDITIGQYYPAESAIHKMDARLKLMITFVFIVTLFLVNTFVGYVFVIACMGLTIRASKVPFKFMTRGLKSIIVIILFTVVINLFMTQGEHVLLRVGFLRVTMEGVLLAAKMCVRLVLLIIGSSVLTLTTTPIQLTDAIEYILKPFKRVGVPAHEIAMMMTIALRFIPTLIEETEKIMNAQKARGAMLDSGTFTQRIKALVPILIPLFISAFRRADELAMAMECRCYHGGEGRTRLKQLKFTGEDFKCLAVIAVALVAIACTRFFVPGLA